METMPAGFKLMFVTKIELDAACVAFVRELRGLSFEHDWIPDAFGDCESGLQCDRELADGDGNAGRHQDFLAHVFGNGPARKSSCSSSRKSGGLSWFHCYRFEPCQGPECTLACRKEGNTEFAKAVYIDLVNPSALIESSEDDRFGKFE